MHERLSKRNNYFVTNGAVGLRVNFKQKMECIGKSQKGSNSNTLWLSFVSLVEP